jgi:hypothetical protein
VPRCPYESLGVGCTTFNPLVTCMASTGLTIRWSIWFWVVQVAAVAVAFCHVSAGPPSLGRPNSLIFERHPSVVRTVPGKGAEALHEASIGSLHIGLEASMDRRSAPGSSGSVTKECKVNFGVTIRCSFASIASYADCGSVRPEKWDMFSGRTVGSCLNPFEPFMAC